MLDVCDGERCVPKPPIDPAQTDTSHQPDDVALQDLNRSSETGWSARFFGGGPILGYRLTDEAGTVVREGHVQVNWVRIDGSEQCGGNRRATAVLPA